MNDIDIELQKQIEKDIKELETLGYSQELYRSISGFSNFAITFSIISVLSGLIMLYEFGLKLVGPFNFWTWVVVSFFQFFMALALGEIVSIYPLAGGVYKWTEKLSNSHIGWFCGFFSLFGWLACTAGIEYGSGIFLASFLGFDINNLNIILGITFFIIAFHTLINIYGIKIVTWFNDFSVNVHIIGVLMLVALLLIFGQKNPVNIILETGNTSGSALFLNFVQALLMSAWTLTAFDAAANVSEESINPSKVVPWGMLFAVIASIILGTVLLFSLSIALPSLESTFNSKMPAALYVIYTSLGPTLYKFVTAFVILAQFAAGLSSQTVLIRIIYSFSRDNNLPFSQIWRSVSPKYDTPIFSALITSVLTLALIVFTRFLPAITSISTIGIYFSYAIVLAAALLNRSKIRSKSKYFNLGKFSTIIQIISLLWALFVTVIMFFSPFSYSGIIFVVFTSILTIYYFTVMRKKFFERKNKV